MSPIKKMFMIKHEERCPAIIIALYIIILNVLNVAKYYDRLSVVAEAYHDIFWNNWSISGYDLHTYSTISKWDVLYDVYRHPLLAFIMYPFYIVDQWLMSLTGVNCATIIVAVLWSILAFWGFILFFRILREVMCLEYRVACLLSLLLYSFGYVMLGVFVPDHFGPSMTLLLFVLYYYGVRMRQGRKVSRRSSMLIFVMTAGITLSNGLKVFLASLMTNGKSFFKPRNFFVTVILSCGVLWGIAELEHSVFVQPKIEASRAKQAEAVKKDHAAIRKAFCDTTTLTDKDAINKGVKKIIRDRAWAKYKEDHKKAWNVNKGKAMGKGKFASWTDISTPRWDSAVENLFGESIQFHDTNFLGDALADRMAIVRYNHWYNYLAEAILALLAVIGVLLGRKDKFVWMVLSFFSVDMLIHFVLGFGLNEIYIMSPHFLFALPICISPLFTVGHRICRIMSECLVAMLALWFFYWNISLLLPFLLA